jgi:hypothetical protein
MYGLQRIFNMGNQKNYSGLIVASDSVVILFEEQWEG